MQVTNVCVVKTKRDKSRPTLSHHDTFYTEKTLHQMTPLGTTLVTIAILWYIFFQCVSMWCSFIIHSNTKEVINKKLNRRRISSERVAVFAQRSEYWLKILVTWCEDNHRQRRHLSQRAEQMIVVVMEGRDGLFVAPHQSGGDDGLGCVKRAHPSFF